LICRHFVGSRKLDPTYYESVCVRRVGKPHQPATDNWYSAIGNYINRPCGSAAKMPFFRVFVRCGWRLENITWWFFFFFFVSWRENGLYLDQ